MDQLTERPRTGAGAGVVDWLLGPARELDSGGAIVDGLSRRLIATGVPLHSLMVAIRQLHPELFAIQHIWRRATGETETLQRAHGIEHTQPFLSSPVPRIIAGEPMVRIDLRQAVGVNEPMQAMRATGATELVVLPLLFSGGFRNIAAFIVDDEQGMGDFALALCQGSLPALAAALELKNLAATAETLLDIYVGHDAGSRILAGAIRRGDVQAIRAVVWFSDLAGSTRLSEVLPRSELIALINGFFERMAAPVERAGGSVLKFMGDGMLAIFPLAADADPAPVANAALAAAGEAAAAMGAWNRERAAAGLEALGYGIALDLGEVMYGNVGAARRLDFTVIGETVNRAARLEALSRTIGRPILVSATLAALATRPLESLGRRRLRGLSQRQQVFALTF